MTAAQYIQHLEMHPHPEGGYYKETYRSDLQVMIDGFDGERSICTSIYFLLQEGQKSAMHRIKSDEIWYHHDGNALEIVEIDETGKEIVTLLGKQLDQGQVLQHVVKAHRWFGARLVEGGKFCLVGCQVSPGFDFRDFELRQQEPA
ncbi:cupin domain-containing protein [Aridibaculum aurantiacum]|uniref:cupin domain-containing protein n=1 Tax=Aridibaculum aurantiacum TaxID=2810307 RepID=UPI001A95A3B7|nr:cupin domain-containing protein [Aridibaculum aurantiacum]